MDSTHAAYDYDNQIWCTGLVGAALHLAQSRETLRLLTGADAARYREFIGVNEQAANYMIKRLRQQIAAAERTPAASNLHQ